MSVFDAIGLKESQVKSILHGEIEKLAKQEKVLLDSIAKSASKINEQYLERQKLSQAMDAERLSADSVLKTAQAVKKEVEDARKALEREKVDVSALHVRLDEAKEIFRGERVAYSEKMVKLEADEKAFNQASAGILDKDKALDNLKDELYLKKRDLDEALKAAGEAKAKLDADKGELLSLKLLIDEEKQKVEEKRKENKAVEDSIQSMMLAAKEEIQKDKDIFLAEKSSAVESLRKRELEIVRKEKELESELLSVKTRLENQEIEASRKRAKK